MGWTPDQKKYISETFVMIFSASNVEKLLSYFMFLKLHLFMWANLCHPCIFKELIYLLLF